ncbi:hypothetical protein IC006_0868 [Sulfuracidifex tepidarius]|uniref:Serine/threonine protein kinase n=1 Tax=Sulfuracidifex tepidarius TaxID=1294262 RepID=A0A510E2P5_9CREN|nr:hypothetical protein IC006_0868 [Sulfuracidifex tepidarius]BBG26328.1 hypothetical protein IC007_0835 [Sulfuracidifex tepidarius]
MKEFIFPQFSKEIETELKEAGITHLLSLGKVKINNVLALGKGKTGIVALMPDYKVVKIRRTDSPKKSMEMECKYQMSAYPVSPEVFLCGRNFILMELADGRELPMNPSPREMKLALISARELEKLKVQHKELVRPWKNVIVNENKAFILDYDSATFKPTPNNVTKILSSIPKLRELGIKYSKGEIDFEKLLDLIDFYL